MVYKTRVFATGIGLLCQQQLLFHYVINASGGKQWSGQRTGSQSSAHVAVCWFCCYWMLGWFALPLSLCFWLTDMSVCLKMPIIVHITNLLVRYTIYFIFYFLFFIFLSQMYFLNPDVMYIYFLYDTS